MKERILDFDAQAEQMLDLIENRLQHNDKSTAKQLLILKFKSVYEQGVAGGKRYAREGIYPFMAIDDN